MTLNDVIFKRKSTRSYAQPSVDEGTLYEIKEYIEKLHPLNENIRTYCEIVPAADVKGGVKAPYFAAIYSEKTDGYLTEVGFRYQQLDLYLQSIGLGSCWCADAKYAPNGTVVSAYNGMPLVIMIGFGKAKDSPYRNISEFKRKERRDISDSPDMRLEPARLAPSSYNDQPWYFLKDGRFFHAYCVIQGFLKAKHADTNLIDMGIAMAQMYTANPDTFRYFVNKDPAQVKGYKYIGSFKI